MSEAVEAFRLLLLESLADPARADYGALRCGWLESGLYAPWMRDREALDELHMRVGAQQWDLALPLAEELVNREPLDIQLRLELARVLDGLGDSLEASDQRRFANGLIRAILRSGDGHTVETAIVVLDAAEQTLVLSALDLRAVRSSLRAVGDRWIDRVEATGARGARVVHFDVTLPQRWLVEGEE
jgi:hypothetical protein